jgi:hypothetical protein
MVFLFPDQGTRPVAILAGNRGEIRARLDGLAAAKILLYRFRKGL